MSPTQALDTRVADEVYLATALLHREQPEREDFTVSEIVNRAAKENIAGELRPGVRVHATLHCVANRAPNPGRYRMLYATGPSTRRLLLAGDDIHPGRTGKMWPDPEAVPPAYRELIGWGKQHYTKGNPRASRWLGGVLELFGTGKEMYRDEDPDEYVRKLREGWD